MLKNGTRKEKGKNASVSLVYDFLFTFSQRNARKEQTIVQSKKYARIELIIF